MKFVRSIRRLSPQQPNGKTIVYMCAYGWYTWQAARQLKVLRNAGYEIVALDFALVLHSKDPKALIGLMDEVVEVFEDEHLISKDTVMVGISIGGLVGLNMIRRYPALNKIIAITGGDITHLPTKYSLKKYWKRTREELAKEWESVNMYTPAGSVKGRHMIMVLPKRDKVIDPQEVKDEVVRLRAHNDMKLIISKGGHLRTIITEVIIFPRRSLPLIQELTKF